MKLWHIGALVALGLVAGELAPGRFGPVFGFATFHVFLPAIIFEAAWQLDLRMVRRGWVAIALLAIPGVAITAAIVASIAYGAAGLSLGTALVLGAVLSATDPVAVTAIFRRLRVPRLLSTIVESESLLNDAIAVVLYRTVLAVLTLEAVSVHAISRAAFIGLAGSLAGIVVGVAVGALGALALRRYRLLAAQVLITAAAAYGGYALCDRFGWSALFATIACAVTMREIERRSVGIGMVENVERAWTAAATVSNAVLFFLVGASVELGHLWYVRAVLMWTLVAVLLARVALAYGLLRLAPRLARSWKTVVRLAGVRGAVSLALALSVPASVPGAQTIVDATFTVVVITVLLGALTYGNRIASLEL